MNLADLFAQTEQQYGLPAGYLARTAQIESAMNPNAKNPNSSAGGLFQFIDSTANQYGLSNRYDPAMATDAAGRLARDNAAYLAKRIGRQPTAAELYLAHQQGAGGAASLLANPNALAASVLGGAAHGLNAGQGGQTAGAFANQWLNKFDGTSLPEGFGQMAAAGAAPQPASFGPIGQGPAAPALGQIASNWFNQQQAKQTARAEEDRARRQALFGGPPGGGLGALYG